MKAFKLYYHSFTLEKQALQRKDLLKFFNHPFLSIPGPVQILQLGLHQSPVLFPLFFLPQSFFSIYFYFILVY